MENQTHLQSDAVVFTMIFVTVNYNKMKVDLTQNTESTISMGFFFPW